MKELEKLINALETENRSRGKRRQPPLTYNEAYSMLTQLLGGDVVSACQSANLKYDVYASTSEGKYTIPRLSEDSEGRSKGGHNSNHQKNRGKGGGGNKPASGKNRNDSVRDDSYSQFCKDFNSPGGCNTLPCNKRHNCSRRLRGGIFCNQKTHGKTTHDEQY